MLDPTFFGSWEQLLIIGLIIFVSQFVYSALGFGSGMIAISLLTLFYGHLEQYLVFFLLVCIPTELFVTCKQSKGKDLKKIGGFLYFILPAMVLGTMMLKKLDNQLLLTGLGIVIVLIALYYIMLEDKNPLKMNSRLWIPFCGTLSGLLGALFGIAAPPLIIYYKNRKIDKGAFRRMLLAIFLFMSLTRLILYLFFSLFTLEILISALYIYPFVMTGLLLGNRFHSRIPEKGFKLITSLVLMISGILHIIKPLFG